MEDIINLINQVGFPVASALGLGFFIWKLINRIIDGMEAKLDVVDEKVAEYINRNIDRQKLNCMITRSSQGVYNFGSKKVTMRLDNKKL